MRWSALKVGGCFAAVALAVGCGKESSVPTNLNQPIPKAAGTGGGGGEIPGAQKGADKDKKTPPKTASD